MIDENGKDLIATHASRGTTRYHYYISRVLNRGKGDGIRIPARELDAAVAERIAAAFADPIGLATDCGLELLPHEFAQLQERSRATFGSVTRRDRALVRILVSQVRLTTAGIEIECSVTAIAGQLGVAPPKRADATFTLTSSARLTRSGRVVKLVHDSGKAALPEPDPGLIKLIAKAHRWWADLRRGEMNVGDYAAQQGVNETYLSRTLRLAFLSPEVVEAIIAGRAAGNVGVAQLVSAGALPFAWAEQKEMIVAAT